MTEPYEDQLSRNKTCEVKRWGQDNRPTYG